MIYTMVCFVLSTGAFIVSVCSFKEKGYVFNNAWLFASKQERGSMDKKPYYRQSAVVFLLIGIMFLLTGVGMLFCVEGLFYVAIAVAVASVIYAVVSGIKIENM